VFKTSAKSNINSTIFFGRNQNMMIEESCYFLHQKAFLTDSVFSTSFSFLLLSYLHVESRINKYTRVRIFGGEIVLGAFLTAIIATRSVYTTRFLRYLIVVVPSCPDA